MVTLSPSFPIDEIDTRVLQQFSHGLDIVQAYAFQKEAHNLKRLTIPGFGRLKKRFCYLQKYLDICSAVPMGFSLSKSATQVSAMRIDSKVDDHLMRGTEESRLEPVTQLFQNTKKIRLEDTNQGNFTRSEETGMGSLSAKALGSVAYVKESDGIEMTDVE